MPNTYGNLVSLRESNIPFSYGERDSMLYALGIGMGRDPLDEAELQYVFEGRDLKVVPTQAIVFCVPGMIWDIGLHIEQFLHGEQEFRFHRPLPAAAKVLNEARVAEVYDRGRGKGSVLELSGTASLDSGEPLVSWVARIIARGDDVPGSDRKVPAPHPVPARRPDVVGANKTRPDQALLYRLSGDRNLVHVDPRIANAAGFPRPILQGACTASFACREILKHLCNYDPDMIEEFDVRWTAPVFPGETIETSMWVDGELISFRCRSVERDVVVIDHGRCKLRTVPTLLSGGDELP